MCVSPVVEIKFATLDDCRSIAEVHVESWQHAYRGILSDQYLASLSVSEREAMWRGMIEQQPKHLLVACTNGQVVGFVAFSTTHDQDAPIDRGEIFSIYVKSTFWSVGAGRLLWLEALQQLTAEGYKSISLWVIAGNRRAIRFYERAGFAIDQNSRKSFELGGTTLDEVRYVRGAG